VFLKLINALFCATTQKMCTFHYCIYMLTAESEVTLVHAFVMSRVDWTSVMSGLTSRILTCTVLKGHWHCLF